LNDPINGIVVGAFDITINSLPDEEEPEEADPEAEVAVLDVAEDPDEALLEEAEDPDEAVLDVAEAPDEAVLEVAEDPDEAVLEVAEDPDEAVLEVAEDPDEAVSEDPDDTAVPEIIASQQVVYGADPALKIQYHWKV